ncbi:MAG: hypothetical protein NC311_05605 [Muribaculaceae bacterium]|nr:hypothetical protein [Muribaculaceae bacterium]
MGLVIIANENTVRDKVFAKYKNVAAFTLSKGLTGATVDDRQIDYEKLTFLPDDDTINAIKAGEKKLKKVIREAVDAVVHPSMDNAIIGLGVTQLISLITANRKSRKGEVVVAFITDDEDPKRNKILVQYITAILNVFGIEPLTKGKVIKDLFKKKSKAKERVIAYVNKKKNHCTLSTSGAALKKSNMIFYEMELRQSAMSGLDLRDLDKDVVKTCVKTLVTVYTADNLRYVKKKTAKRLAKKDKKAVGAYKSLYEILQLVNPDIKMPKVKYGQEKNKKGEAKGPKMNVKKFTKFFSKKGNRRMLIPIYGHTLAVLLDLEIGSKDYNAHMKSVCSVFDGDFGKQFIAAANTYAKGGSK